MMKKYLITINAITKNIVIHELYNLLFKKVVMVTNGLKGQYHEKSW
jgi:hypothetical protein